MPVSIPYTRSQPNNTRTSALDVKHMFQLESLVILLRVHLSGVNWGVCKTPNAHWVLGQLTLGLNNVHGYMDQPPGLRQWQW